jgi:tetratricopeptide (TPR) repeat protein
VQEGLVWFERLLAQVDERISLTVRVKALTFASFLAMFLDNALAATEYGREAVALAEAAGEQGQPVLPFALAALATGARTARDYPTALAIQERFIAWARESGDAFYLGMSLLAQGEVSIELGSYDEARILLNELRISRCDRASKASEGAVGWSEWLGAT